MSVAGFDVTRAAQALLQARQGAPLLDWQDVLPPDLQGAWAVQDAVADALGGVGAWKVGAGSPAAEPGCAPLPAAGVLPSGSGPGPGPALRMRGIEVEVALRLGRDLPAPDRPPDPATLLAAVAEVLPAIEVVETRLADWRACPELAHVADQQLHGALVLGAPSATAADAIDLRQLTAYLAFDGQPVASARGAHGTGDFWPLLGWLAVHCTRRGRPLRAGQVVTTGSCSGLLFAPEGAKVEAELGGVGRVWLQF